jgi:6-pyruvoyltetrahydropterin/6-carboxytetrahydropterin synthase
MLLRKTFRFEASHILPKHPGKCSRLHGHSWVLHVEVEGKINKDTGFVMDFADMSKAVKPLIEKMDHKHLGSWNVPWTGLDLSPNVWLEHNPHWAVGGLSEDFYPSSENLLIWIGDQLANAGLGWSKLALEETCTSYAELDRKEFEETCQCERVEAREKAPASREK